MVHPGTLIHAKTRVPALARPVIERARVIETFQGASRDKQVLQVVASAGSGKTTAVVQFLASRSGPHAWLSLGEADGSPGRFTTYLAAATEAFDPGAPERTGSMLARGIAPADCAALLAERLPSGSTLVIDDLHLVEFRPPVLSVLRALVEAVAPQALLILVSRRLVHLNLSRSILNGRAAIVSGRDLSFTTDEVRQLLAARGVEASAEDITTTSGGWAAGIVFDALRGPRPASGPLEPEDPFFAYLGAEVLDELPPDLRRAVVRSAILETVDAAGLESLLEAPSGDALLRAMMSHQLPATAEREGLRYHPRFREFLMCRLREHPDEMRALLVRHAGRLRDEGRLEEAADRLIEAGELHEALGAIEAATPALLARGDWEKVLDWCDAVGEDALSRRASLRGCQLRAIFAGTRRGEGPAIVQALRASGEYDRLVHEAPGAAATAVFGLHFSMDWGFLVTLLPADEAAPWARTMRHVLQVGSGRTPPRAFRAEELEWLAPTAPLLLCSLYLQGRVADVERVAGIIAPQDGARIPYVIAGLREQGRLAEARGAFDAAAPFSSAAGWRDFWRHLEAELVFAEGDRERGLELVREARELTRSLGHQPADRAIFAVTEGKMLVRLGRTGEAIELLRATSAWCEDRGLPCFREWADTWLAAALLESGQDPASVLELLEGAIGGMRSGGRMLELCAAWVILAEARWRAGDQRGHDEAAEAARAAALGMRTLEPLLAVLDDFPDVRARRVAAGGAEAAAWRTLGRPTAPVPVGGDVDRPRILLGTLGRPRVEVDGVERELSPSRALRVAASVARAGARGASRASLARDVVNGSTDAANYLRQIIHRLRRLVPEGVELLSENGVLRWSPPGAVITEDQLLTSLLMRAAGEADEARRATLAAALELADQGPLDASDESPAATRRREELAAAVSDARRAYAELLLAAGQALDARTAARAAVADDPYHEEGWRLVMRAADAVSGPSAAVPAYLECVRALKRVGLEPSGETNTLLERLRDAAPGQVARAGAS